MMNVLILLLCVLPTVISTHFLGGSIMVQPKAGIGAVNKEIEIISHFSWRRSEIYYCDSNTLANSNTIIGTLNLWCEYGCYGSINVSFVCIEYSVENDWSYLEGHETHVFNVYDESMVTIGIVRGDWSYPYVPWNVSTTFSLVTRPDTGKINSSPRVVSFPKFRLLEGHNYSISIAVTDPDGDEVQCRWANDTECLSVCDSIPGAVLDPNTCTINYEANFGLGLKAVAIMVEDYPPCSTVPPLSSVAHQFVVEVVSSSQTTCHNSMTPWVFALNSSYGECITIPPGAIFTKQLIAGHGCSNISITSIQVIAPVGMSKGEIYPLAGYYFTNITWTPTASQQNDTHILCFMAVSSDGLTSNQSCIKLAVGYHPPLPLPETATSNHQSVYPSINSRTLQIMFDRKIQRPSTSNSAFIRFYRSEELVHQIDTSASLEVNFNGPILTIVPNYIFNEENIYHITFDEGVVESVEGCQLRNDPILSDTFWTFKVINLLPDVTSVTNPLVGQPLILQCSATTIRDVNSRVDFVWYHNGTELKRVEGVTGVSSTSNLVNHTDYYIISQLSTADNNSVYTCKVTVNRSPLVSRSATGNITLRINGLNVMDADYYNSAVQPCSLLPQFVEPTLPPTVCIAILPGTPFIQQIMVASDNCSNIEITSIKIFAPIGVSIGELQHVQDTNDYYIHVAWMPTPSQQNKTYFLCFVAANSAGLCSEPFCMQLAIGHYPPAPIPTSANHQLVYPSNASLHIMFDRNIQCPTVSSFIRFFTLAGEEVYKIDASSSPEVTVTGSSLTIVPNYTFTEGANYYINFDRGVVQSVDTVKACHLMNEPISSKTLWTFEVADLSSEVTLMNDTCADVSDDGNDDKESFIILFAVSLAINAVILIIMSIFCWRKLHKKNCDNQLFGEVNIQSYDTNDPDAPPYETVSLKARFASTKHPAKPAADENVNIEGNPSYFAVNPEAAEDKANVEEKYYYVTVN